MVAKLTLIPSVKTIASCSNRAVDVLITGWKVHLWVPLTRLCEGQGASNLIGEP